MIDITITIEWKKSRTWGANPHLFAEGGGLTDYNKPISKCSGCGYDKRSTVFGEFLNLRLSRLIQLLKRHKGESTDFRDNGLPYGYSLYDGKIHAGMGCGTGSLQRGLEVIHCTLKHVSDTKWTDCYILSIPNRYRHLIGANQNEKKK
jgi:hypothetical protein